MKLLRSRVMRYKPASRAGLHPFMYVWLALSPYGA